MPDTTPGTLDVLLYDERVATLTASHDVMTLEYLSRDATPLSPSLDPRRSLIWKDRRPDRGPVAAYIEGLLPENAADRRRLVSALDITGRPTPYRLISAVGLDCPGAVRFCRRQDTRALLNGEGRLIPLTDEQVNERLGELLLRTRPADAGIARWSLPGYQTKAAYRITSDGRWWVPVGAEPTNVIVKPSMSSLYAQARNERACLMAARDAGLDAAHTDVITRMGADFVLSWRFDRIGNPDGRMIRVHQMDFCQILGVPSELKYEEDGGPSLTDILHAARSLSSGGDGDRDGNGNGNGDKDGDMPYQVLRQAMFNVLVGSTDLHAKNMSVQLSPEGVYHMAPMYDVASFAPYAPMEELAFSYRIEGSRSFADLCEDERWGRFARKAGLDPARAVSDFRRLRRTVPERLEARIMEGVDGPMAFEMVKRLRAFWSRIIQ